MAQSRYECSQCTKISCNKQAADQHNRDMHGGGAHVSPVRTRRDLLAEIARLTAERDQALAANERWRRNSTETWEDGLREALKLAEDWHQVTHIRARILALLNDGGGE